MIVISKTFSLSQHYDFSSLAPLKDIVFLDIETTGLSPFNSSLYLIGAVYHQQMEWHIRQWFAESLSAEQEILEDFFLFLKNYKVIFTYNGDGFDLPYLLHCAQQFSLTIDIDHLTSIDLYKKIRPLKKLLSLENLKLSTIEAFLGIERSNAKTGKDMISIYQKFLETNEEEPYQMLLSHNEENLKTLPQLIPLLGYLEIFHCPWTLAGYSINPEQQLLTAVLDATIRVPVAVTYEVQDLTLSIRANQIILEMTICTGELKYFFENYTEYDYLPDEDRAIHHKVAQFVDKEHREKATPATCYTKKQGIFLPLFTSDSMFPVFKSSYLSKKLYTEYVDDPDFLLSYLRLFLEGTTDTQ